MTAAILVLSFLAVGNPSVRHSAYIAAISDKEIILKKTASPKIVFVGGSSLAFGLDSQEIESQLKMPVVNMGLHSAVGLNFMLEQVKSHIHAGDVVVIVPEYEILTVMLYGGGETWELAETFFVYPESLKYITSFKQIGPILSVMRLLFEEHRKSFFESEDSLRRSGTVYRREGFNRYGDMTLHLDLKMKCAGICGKIQSEGLSYDLSAAAALLNSFYDYGLSRQAKVFLVPPPFPSSDPALKIRRKMYEKLEALTEISVLTSPEQFFFPKDHFLDTNYHLNKEGRERWTREVAALLKEALSA